MSYISSIDPAVLIEVGVDCLLIADGADDRGDDDYAFGDDEPSVLCASVVVVVAS